MLELVEGIGLVRRSCKLGFWIGLWVLCHGRIGQAQSPGAELNYTNYQIAKVPWSIHVVRIPRTNSCFEIHSVHADGRALGLNTLSQQIALVKPEVGTPIAALNGDFYQRDNSYAGDPRGLQIIAGEVISAPSGGASFWIDGFDEPHATNVASLFQLTWPDGTVTACGLNEDRPTNGIVLYTPSLGRSTHTAGGREFILRAAGTNPWLPLRMPRTYTARVWQINESGDTLLEPGMMVLSVGPSLVHNFAHADPGARLVLSIVSIPGLRGAKTAISGGPVLLRNGRKEKMPTSPSTSFEFTSMFERHPRSAIGWNERCYFLVEVDGRQEKLSVGMTLEELTSFLMELGCQDGMNLDGGGSATLWYDGKVRNNPCDGHERDIANSLVVIEKKATTGTRNASVHR